MYKLSPVLFQYESASARLVPISKHLYSLSNVWSNHPGQGDCKHLLQSVIEFAEDKNVSLILTVQAYSHPDANILNNNQLESLYSRFGFVRDQDSERPYTMTRLPSQELHDL